MKAMKAILASSVLGICPLAHAQSGPQVQCWIESSANGVGQQSTPVSVSAQETSSAAGSFQLLAKLQNSGSQLNVKIKLGSTASWADFKIGTSSERVSNSLQIGIAVATAFCDIYPR